MLKSLSTAKIILLVVPVFLFLALLASGTAADNGSLSSTTRRPTPAFLREETLQPLPNHVSNTLRIFRR
ncbi:hypothetical protein Ocin01_07591 [Orchesella cincta]|uniref:Uncharacterized protein n=1 Tax=Orchesella cincta TaxID=48709 RepID=A0A1D2N1A3_ORCCI|nr:hypothetical protein Ocin01_07591 [Orchesella cincta]